MFSVACGLMTQGHGDWLKDNSMFSINMLAMHKSTLHIFSFSDGMLVVTILKRKSVTC